MKHPSDQIDKISNDTTMVGLITNNNEAPDREELEKLNAWYKANNFFLNVNKTKEMVIDFIHPSLHWRYNGGNSELFQTSRSAHLRQPFMNPEHIVYNHESSPVS